MNHSFTKSLQQFKITHELPFILKLDGQITKGYIDMVVEKDNEIIIIDFKTDHNVSKDDLISRYQKQLNTYKIALSNTTKEIKTYIYSLSLNDYIEL